MSTIKNNDIIRNENAYHCTLLPPFYHKYGSLPMLQFLLVPFTQIRSQILSWSFHVLGIKVLHSNHAIGLYGVWGTLYVLLMIFFLYFLCKFRRQFLFLILQWATVLVFLDGSVTKATAIKSQRARKFNFIIYFD